MLRKEDMNVPKIIEDLENRILLAARRLLLEEDLSSFSARRIAEDCGIAVGTIYNYYRDLDSLLGAVMARDWIEALESAEASLLQAESFEAGARCLYGAIRRFSSVYERVWQSYPTGEGFGVRYRKRHPLLLGQIEERLRLLSDRFGKTPPPGELTLLSELIIAAGQHPEVEEKDLDPFLRCI